MKRMFGLVLAFLLCFVLGVCACAYSVEFNKAGDLEGWVVGTHMGNSKVENGMLTFDILQRDPQLYLNNRAYDLNTKKGGIVNGDECKSIEIRFATTVTKGYIEVFFTSVNPETGEYISRPYKQGDTEPGAYTKTSKQYPFTGTGSMDDFITLTIDRTQNAYWKGIISTIRLDMTDDQQGHKFAVDYIRFNGGDLGQQEPEPEPEPEVPVVPVKTQKILDEEKQYGECLFFDDFESYKVGAVPTSVYYANKSGVTMTKADQCASYEVVTGIGGNDTKLMKLVSTGSYKYPFLSIGYRLEDKGEVTLLLDGYTDNLSARKWTFHVTFSASVTHADSRYRVEPVAVEKSKWQSAQTVVGTIEKEGLTSMNSFRFGASNVDKDEVIYIDNIRAYFKPYLHATVNAGGAEGTVPEISFVQNSSITFPQCNLTKEGYTFDGWKTNLGSKIYMPGEKLNVGLNKNITITAVWCKFKPVTVRKNSIRTDAGLQGMRFAAYVTRENKEQADEYGFIVAVASVLGDKPLMFGENTSDNAGVTPDGVRYMYGAAFNKEKGIDKIYATNGEIFSSAYWKEIEGIYYAGILTGIPEAAFSERIVVRPYARVGDTYSYGETITRSVRDIAQNAYDNGSREDYVMNILNKTKNLPNTKVCFFGDSITHSGKFIRELYEHYLKSDKEMGRLEMYNVGISGDTASGALARIDDDLMYYDPDIVVIMLGMNDIKGGLYKKGMTVTESIEQQRKEMHDKYESEMTQIFEKLAGYGVEVIICTPTPYDDITDTVYERSVGLAKCAEFLREYAKEHNLKLIDHFANIYPKYTSGKYIQSDFVHPNDLGHHLMAESVMYSLGYIDEMQVDKEMTTFDDDNFALHEINYNFQMMSMVERSLRRESLTTREQKMARAEQLKENQTSSHWKWIYQNYIDTVDKAIETREDIIRRAEELSYKKQ